MSHIEQNGPSQMALYITSDVTTSGQVEISDNSFPAIPFNVKARQVTKVQIPHSAFIKGQGQYMRGLHIIAQNNIAVYGHIYATSVSGATLLLPVNVLGKTYYSINYQQASNSDNDKVHTYSTFMVIATEDNTTVEILPFAQLVGGQPRGTAFTIQLKKGEVFQGLSLEDLTGTRIRSVSTSAGDCKKIAVFSGSTKIGIGCREGNFTSDNLFQQVYPTTSWGKKYITAPLKNRFYDIFRVILSDPDTKLTVNGVDQDLADKLYYEFTSTKPNVIAADKPIQVVQYAVSQNETLNDCEEDKDDLGDPEMIYLSPLEQTIDHVTLYSSPYFAISKHYINVVIKKDAANSFTLDGKPAGSFKAVPLEPDYAYAQLEVNQGTHYISASDGFNAIAYGFGQAESYGYAAGTNLKNLNQSIALGDKSGSKITVSGCQGVEYKLQLTLPYQTTNIKWNIDDKAIQYEDKVPTVKGTIQREGKTLYIYEYKDLLTFDLGEHKVTATVLNPLADECGSATDIDFQFTIASYPTVDFKITGSCPGDETAFTDLTQSSGNDVKTWLWDFGDGSTSIEQNPKHVYAKEGTYKVILTTSNQNDCSATKEVKLIIAKKPVALFKASATACLEGVTFTDQSTIEKGSIAQWSWDFGDGQPAEVHTDNKPFVHIFSSAGQYTVSLKAIAASGCESIVYTLTVDVKPSPKVDFVLPDICLADGTAHFKDQSTIEGGGEAGFTYLWTFGDEAKSGPGNPNTSTSKNPSHTYSAVGDYTITLTVTSADGCSSTKTGTLTVNGAIPAAKFRVANSAALCSSSPVAFTDESQPVFGRVTKVVWYFDADNHPTESETFTRADMPTDRTFYHDYGLFNTPAKKTFTVRMEAYSGETCMAVTQQQITINANPVVAMAQVDPQCYSAGPVQIAVDNKRYAGTGVFSGRGVSAGGMFDPQKAGVGLTQISYTFTSPSGCEVTVQQEILVKPEPTVNAGEKVTILEDNFTILHATASGNGLLYKWYPSTGLDRDDIANPVASPTETTTYVLTVTNQEGCSVSDEVVVTVLKKPLFANTFTPNGDGVNDYWVIKYLNTYPGNTVNIYNRNGEKVYSSVGYATPWDGRYKGSDLPAGTYYYIIDPKNGRKAVAGNVTIIR